MAIAGIIVSLIAAYFLVAAFFPRIRMRWGVRFSADTITLKPHMGMVSCLGIALFIGPIALAIIWNQIQGEWVFETAFTGFGMTFVGAMMDYWNEPTITRKKRRRFRKNDAHYNKSKKTS